MKTKKRLSQLILLAGLVAFGAGSLRGATQYADSTTTTTWDNGISALWGNGSGGPYNTVWTSGNDGVFEATAGTITIGAGGATAHNLSFASVSGYLITGSTLTLNATTPTITNGPGVTTTIGSMITGAAGLAVDGGGTLNLTSSNGFTAGNFNIGTLSANNTVNVTGSGRLVGAAGIILNVGSSTFGGNKLLVSTPGVSSNMSLRAYHLNLGTASSDNEIIITNGAYFGVLNSGNGTWNIGANAGANNNRLIITGDGSIVTRTLSQGSGIQTGVSGDSNYVQVLAGAIIRPLRLASIGSAGGDYNYMLISGAGVAPSTYEGSNYNQTIFNIGASAGAVGNSFRIENGGRALNVGATGNGVSRDFTVGYGAGSSNNYLLIKDAASTMFITMTQPLGVGGKIANGTVDDTTAALNNHIDIYSGGVLTIAATTSLYLMGVDSAFNLGNGIGISTSTVGANGGAFTNGVYLKNASARVNFNSGLLTASAGGALISGLGKVQLNGPAYFSTTFANSTNSCEITGGGSLVKEGSGTLTLTFANTSYSGLTTVSNGVLNANVTNSLGTGDLSISTGGKVEVPAGVIVAVNSLKYNGGALEAAGTYGATGSGADNINDTYFAGTGKVNVLTGGVPNTSPVAGADTLGAKKNTAATVTEAKLLSNDTDADVGQTLSVTAVSATSTNGGTVGLSAGVVTYTPVAGYSGADQFTYTLTDSLGASVSGTVNVTVTAPSNTSLNTIGVSGPGVGGAITIQFAGIPNQTYDIQASEDLVTWAVIGSATAGSNGLFQFIDTDAINHPQRFYRTLVP